MYDIDNNEVNKIIQSKKAFSYNKKDELFNAIIVLKSKTSINSISADYIVRRGFLYKFYDNVYINKSNGFELNTNFLVYDDLHKVLKNDTSFKITLKDDTLTGKELYYDILKEKFRANDIEFKLNF